MQNNLAVVYLDAPPLARSIHHITDYSSFLIYSLSSLPLTKISHSENKCQDLSATCEKSTDNKYFEFKIKSDLYWCDGRKIKALDYYKMFGYILSNKNNRYRSMLSDVHGYGTTINNYHIENLSGIECSNETIIFKLNQSNYFFPMILSFPIFSPMHTTHSQYCSGGAYYVENSDLEVTRLKKNDFFKIKPESSSIDEIVFKYTENKTDFFSLNAFGRGCNAPH